MKKSIHSYHALHQRPHLKLPILIVLPQSLLWPPGAPDLFPLSLLPPRPQYSSKHFNSSLKLASPIKQLMIPTVL